MINFALVAPEIFLACAGMLILLYSVFRGEDSLVSTAGLSVVAMAITAIMIGRQQPDGLTLHDMFGVGPFQNFVKLLLLAASAACLVFLPQQMRHIHSAKPEAAVLVIFATLGMMLMVSAADFVSLYVGIELQNLALYVLVSLRRDDPRSSEAGLKYFTLGALSSAILLFGLSFVYGFSGTTSFAGIHDVLVQTSSLPLGLGLGLVLVLCGLAFKISAAPFHAWTPDVYEGAPMSVTAFLTSAPKIAALSLVMLVLAGPFVSALTLWQPIIIVLSVASMTVGSIGGLLQTKIKRLMGYSAIANIGAMLVGAALVGTNVAVDAIQGALVYLAVYAFGTLGVFGSLMLIGRKDSDAEDISDLSGLSQTHPVAAAILAISLFSLAGIPPLAGFFGKYFVLLAAVQGGLTWLAIIGVVTSVIAAAYYLKIIKVMYFDEHKGLPLVALSGKTPQILALLIGLSVILFVVSPTFLTEGAFSAAEGVISR